MPDRETTAWYAIGAVAKKTGLSVHTLRAWERRYGVVEPQRSGGGTRLYSTADIDRLRLLRRATEMGHAIGQVAGLDTDELRELVREELPTASEVAEVQRTGDEAEWLVEEVLRSVEVLDGPRVHALLMRAVVQLSVRDVVERVIAPVLQKAGDLWAAGTICPANEHLLSVNMRRVLSWLLESVPVPEGAPAMVVTTPAGHWHDLGAQVAAIMAAVTGWRVVFLGPNLPADDIAKAVEVVDAAAVLLGITTTYGEDVLDELKALRRQVDADVAIFIGGRGADVYQEELGPLGVRYIPGWRDVEEAVVGNGRMISREAM